MGEEGVAVRVWVARIKAEGKEAEISLILLDTNAVLWLSMNHRRTRALSCWSGHLFLSPVTLLEIQFLIEANKSAIKKGFVLSDLLRDSRWLVDDISSAVLFEHAQTLSWTRDPFDRMLAAHAIARRWRLATADASLLEHMSSRNVLAI